MMLKLPTILAISACATLLLACDRLVDGSNAAASVTDRAFQDATSTWSDIFTYHPKKPPPAPQTRYCYQFQSDVVCYDSIQPNSTSKLVGYQDGDRISWVQPGGGSLGASGGDPVALSSTGVSAARASDYSPAFVNDSATAITTTNLPPAAAKKK